MKTLREQLQARREKDAGEYRHANLAYHDSDGVDVVEVHKAGATPRDDLIEKLAAVVKELVDLKDIKDCTGPAEPTRFNYLKRKPKAWDAARAMIAELDRFVSGEK